MFNLDTHLSIMRYESLSICYIYYDTREFVRALTPSYTQIHKINFNFDYFLAGEKHSY